MKYELNVLLTTYINEEDVSVTRFVALASLAIVKSVTHSGVSIKMNNSRKIIEEKWFKYFFSRDLELSDSGFMLLQNIFLCEVYRLAWNAFLKFFYTVEIFFFVKSKLANVLPE